MSLLTEATETFVRVLKNAQTDDYGTYTTDWQDGEQIKAAVTYSTHNENRIGNVQEDVEQYTITTERSVILAYHDVIKRVRDGKLFRVTSNGNERQTPLSAGLNMRQVQAEDYTLPR